MALRLGLLTVLLVLVGVLELHNTSSRLVFSGQLMLGAVGASFALAGAQAVLLRQRSRLRAVAYSQIVADQLTWTVLAYVTGGVASGAASFYGLTCLTAAVVEGAQGVVVAAVVAAGFFGTMCLGFTSGLLPPPPDQLSAGYLTRWKDISYPFSQSLLGLTIVALLTAYLAERLRRTGGQLAAATERAEQAERLALLGRFAAGLAHEIRNPLGAISGSIELLAQGPTLTEEDRVLCEIVARETARLNDLMTDMLDLARPRKPDLGLVDAAVVAGEVVRLAAQSGRGSDVRVLHEGPEGGIEVQADAAQLRQILWNLVRNAIQASSAGATVRVRVERRAGAVVIEVSDEGQGIDDATIDQLFDAFFTTRTHGVGMGLAVVRRIVDDHRWRIEVDGGQGRGATFRVICQPAP
jgi:signal transduction histidine kinase